MGADPTEGPSFVPYMRNAGLIDQSVVSFSLGYDGIDESYVQIGSINHEQYVGDLHSFPLVNKNWWSLHMHAFMYDEEVIASFPKAQYEGKALAVIDTGTSLIGIPTKYFSTLTGKWMSDLGFPSSSEFDCQ